MFQEMASKELMETNGGVPWIPLIIIGVLVTGCLGSCSNSCDCE